MDDEIQAERPRGPVDEETAIRSALPESADDEANRFKLPDAPTEEQHGSLRAAVLSSFLSSLLSAWVAARLLQIPLELPFVIGFIVIPAGFSLGFVYISTEVLVKNTRWLTLP